MKGKSSRSLGRNGVIMKCSLCQGEGHNNKKKCPQQIKDKVVSVKCSSVLGKRKETHNKLQAKTKQSKAITGNATFKTRRVVGMGIYIDDNTGNATFSPGMSSETIITQRDPIASQKLSSNPDPVIRFPIPNEREMRLEQQQSIPSTSTGSIRIAIAATGTQSIVPTNLPFKPPGPQWRGKSCMTSSQLEKLRDKKKNKKL